MNKIETILCLIKFGKKHHLESLLHEGGLYFNSTKVFNKIKTENREQGDENEGAEWIENMKSIQITCNHPTLGEFKFYSVPNKLSKLTQFNHNYLACSFYAITTKDFENTDTLKIDERMLEFGAYALIINKPKIFLNSLIESSNLQNLDLVGRKVDYEDLTTEGRIEMSPFIKKSEHLHQKEYRIIINSQNEPKLIRIEGIKGSGKIVPSTNLVEATWKVMSK